MKPFYLNLFFEYEDYMRRLYRNQQDEKREGTESFVPQKLEKSYYAFLQHFDLNNPPQLSNNMYYSMALRSILNQSALNIPQIGDTPIADWLKGAKAVLNDLAGIQSGLFYDILAAEAYINQFWDKLNPLSERQKENILNYFSNPLFAEILFAENERTLLQLEEIEKNKQTNLAINKTPAVAIEKLMDTIISKYKGKVVLVDFWATWCHPCLIAIQKMKSLKDEMKDKNIVFVYITNRSSPKELWEKKIEGIGGEHYYLNDEEWESLSFSEKYGFDGIPTYLIFDKKGVLKHKITAYPGNEKMREIIEELF